MRRLCKAVAVLLTGSAFYAALCLHCVADRNNVSPEDYARMARELVEQSLQGGVGSEQR